jgi:hypothetical protein
MEAEEGVHRHRMRGGTGRTLGFPRPSRDRSTLSTPTRQTAARIPLKPTAATADTENEKEDR